MARNFLQLGNGRGNCQLCGNKIKKGIPQISHRAYQSSASFHANAKDCFPRSKLYIKKNGCPHCFVIDKDGIRKSRWSDSYECTHCYKKVDEHDTVYVGDAEESFEAQGKWAGYCPFCQKWRSNEMSKKDGKLTICAKRVPSPHTNAGEWDWFNRENFARKGGKWTKPADNICGVILESKPTYLDSKNAEVLNMEEPMVEEPDFIPNGDGRAIGQQNSSINLTPLHAETNCHCDYDLKDACGCGDFNNCGECQYDRDTRCGCSKDAYGKKYGIKTPPKTGVTLSYFNAETIGQFILEGEGKCQSMETGKFGNHNWMGGPIDENYLENDYETAYGKFGIYCNECGQEAHVPFGMGAKKFIDLCQMNNIELSAETFEATQKWECDEMRKNAR